MNGLDWIDLGREAASSCVYLAWAPDRVQSQYCAAPAMLSAGLSTVGCDSLEDLTELSSFPWQGDAVKVGGLLLHRETTGFPRS